MRVADLAHGRSGDKGDTCNVGIVAWDDAGYATLRAALTEERVAAHYGDLVKGSVTRYELPGIRAFNFVLAATPALLVHRHVEPLLDAADELRRRTRASGGKRVSESG